MTDGRLATGIPGLDAVLGGGLNSNSITLVCGPPGSGKTILAQRCAFEDPDPDRPAVYLSTVSEPYDKVIRFGQTLDYFDPAQVGRALIFEDLGTSLMRDGLDGVVATVDRVLKECNPSLVVIDSFAALAAFAPSEEHYRRFLHGLAGRMSAIAVTTIWVGETTLDELAGRAEFAVADTVVYLHTNRTADREMRVLTVLKHRGSAFLSGEHAYRLDTSGVRVFPRLADPPDVTSYTFEDRRASTGIAALDSALGDGYQHASSTLIAGPSGTGKTLMGLHYLYAGAAIGEHGVLASFQENPAQMARVAAGFGWELPGERVHLMYWPPIDVYLDEWVYHLLDLVEEVGATRVVIDSLGDLRISASDELRFREYIYSLLARFSRAGIGAMMTFETTELFRTTMIGELGMSHLSDNVVLLQHVLDGDELKNGLVVLKTRASRHDPMFRQFEISTAGITLGEPLPLPR